MAQRGRKPKPTAVKELEGNPGKRAINEFEPKPKKKAPKCPAWLEAEAKKEWRRVAKQLEELGILTEAHSSQTGEAAKKLKKALGNTEEALEEYSQYESEIEENTQDYEDKLVDELISHGRLGNLSFFAFTATPKEKTLQQFGIKQPDGTYRAFHIYSMRQAIEEHFILDVLKNYITYKMYYKIVKKATDDPNIDTSKATKQISKYESLHPHNLAQKTAIMVEHFRSVTKNKIDGKAKAMVVTSSRLHAVRYLFEFRRYIEAQGYKDLDVLVAFSGKVDDNKLEWTEEKINKDKNGKTIKEN